MLHQSSPDILDNSNGVTVTQFFKSASATGNLLPNGESALLYANPEDWYLLDARLFQNQ